MALIVIIFILGILVIIYALNQSSPERKLKESMEEYDRAFYRRKQEREQELVLWRENADRILKELITLPDADGDITLGKILFIDTETTGLPKDRKALIEDLDNWPRIVQIAWILTDETGNVLKSRDYILKQQGKIPPQAIEKHGITDEIAAEKGVDPTVVLSELQNDLDHCKMVVAHNIEYDYPIIEAEFLRHGFYRKLIYKWLCCTMKEYTSGGYIKLEKMMYKLFFYYFPDDANFEFDVFHNAINDVTIMMKCFFKMLTLRTVNGNPAIYTDISPILHTIPEKVPDLTIDVSGKNVFFIGTMKIIFDRAGWKGREYFEEIFTHHGANIVKSLKNDVIDIVLVGDRPNEEKVAELKSRPNVKLIHLEDFTEMFIYR